MNEKIKPFLISFGSIALGIFMIYFFLYHNPFCFIFIGGAFLILFGIGVILLRNRRGGGGKGKEEMYDNMDERERGQIEQSAVIMD